MNAAGFNNLLELLFAPQSIVAYGSMIASLLLYWRSNKVANAALEGQRDGVRRGDWELLRQEVKDAYERAASLAKANAELWDENEKIRDGLRAEIEQLHAENRETRKLLVDTQWNETRLLTENNNFRAVMEALGIRIEDATAELMETKKRLEECEGNVKRLTKSKPNGSNGGGSADDR